MRKFIYSFFALLLLFTSAGWAQNATDTSTPLPTPAASDENAQLRQELDQMKKAVADLEERLAAQEKKATAPEESKAQESKDQPSTAELAATVKDLDQRIQQTERRGSLDRINFSGDYRFQAHSIWGQVPAHYDGMQLQNLVVKTLFYANTNGGMLPGSVDAINSNVAQHYSDYQYFTNNLTFNQLKSAMAQFPPEMQQQLFGMLQPSTFVPAYSNDTNILYTNRLRLNLDSRINDDLTVSARLSMYKAWGDSTGVQVFNGQPILDEHRRHHCRSSQLRHAAGRARLFHLEPCGRLESVRVDRPAALNRWSAAELPQRRTPRRNSVGRPDRLPVRRYHRRLPLQRQHGVAAMLRSRIPVGIRQWQTS